jgi:hypothetical protein
VGFVAALTLLVLRLFWHIAAALVHCCFQLGMLLITAGSLPLSLLVILAVAWVVARCHACAGGDTAFTRLIWDSPGVIRDPAGVIRDISGQVYTL